ncbi:transposase [Streptomyces goshikiensis]|uniref:transposase n=1 Tax=Streptomyces goshikiensis TaxID=1942 RepID=UPI0036AA0FDF
MFRQVAGLLAVAETPGAWWRGPRLLALDGTQFDVPDSVSNGDTFDAPSTGGTPFRTSGSGPPAKARCCRRRPPTASSPSPRTAGSCTWALLDTEHYPADELIALYRQRWEIELTFDEIENHLGPGGPLRSRPPQRAVPARHFPPRADQCLEGSRPGSALPSAADPVRPGLAPRDQEADAVAHPENPQRSHQGRAGSVGKQPDQEGQEASRRQQTCASHSTAFASRKTERASCRQPGTLSRESLDRLLIASKGWQGQDCAVRNVRYRLTAS